MPPRPQKLASRRKTQRMMKITPMTKMRKKHKKRRLSISMIYPPRPTPMPTIVHQC